ncbi:MAG: DNA translocase FtsK 4TM domain-containing protein, partial [Clostridia bacterium]|nr:DNA translocase FtsK 4TM domain-containing protein [Clostridia bacterium]
MPKKKTTKPAKKSKAKSTNPEKSTKNYEITGICIIAVSIFFAISVYTGSGGTVGSFISSVLMGLFGYCAYLLPVITIAAMIYFLFCEDKRTARNKAILSAIAYADLTAIFHMLTCAHAQIDFGMYYSYAQLHPSGGILGACLGMPMQSFLGVVGANILFFAIITILFICIFNISLVRVVNGIVRMIGGTVDKIKSDIEIIKEE